MKGSLNLIKDTINVLLEAVPFDVKLEDIKSALMEINEVRDVHDVHVWCLTPEIKMLTCHIVIDAQSINKTSELISHINSILKEKFNIGHSTIQIETLN
jgi:cobalt-zinc-cadmium efflux system protein